MTFFVGNHRVFVNRFYKYQLHSISGSITMRIIASALGVCDQGDQVAHGHLTGRAIHLETAQMLQHVLLCQLLR